MMEKTETHVQLPPEEAFILQFVCIPILSALQIYLIWRFLKCFSALCLSRRRLPFVRSSPPAKKKVKVLCLRSHTGHDKTREAFASSTKTHDSFHVTLTKSSCSKSGRFMTSQKEFRCHKAHKLSKGWRETLQDVSNASLKNDLSKDEFDISYLLKMVNSLGSCQAVILGQRPNRRPRTAHEKDKTTQEKKMQPTEFTAVNIAFLDRPMISWLDSHLVGKRVQHLMGLPSALHKPLRSFMPPTPSFPLLNYTNEVHVMPRPELLFCLPADTKKNLEHHLNNWIQQKHWKIPQRMQEALKCLKPPSPPPAVVHPRRSEDTQGAAKMHKIIHSSSATVAVLDLKVMLASQAKMPSYLVKKCLQIRLVLFLEILSSSEMMAGGKVRNWSLLKLISPGHVSVQFRSKLLHFLWDLPTLYMQSMRTFCPSVPKLPIPHSEVPGTIKCSHVELHFLPLRCERSLESPVLKKRLHHQWGLPGLVLRSLSQFLLPAPPAQPGATLHGQITDTGCFPFISSGTKQDLERDLKRRILQIQWSILKRVCDPLQTFLPVAALLKKAHKDNCKSRDQKKMAPTTRQSTSKEPAGGCSGRHCPDLSEDQRQQRLQRHLAKKTLEIHLGAATPVVLCSHHSSSHAVKMTLPNTEAKEHYLLKGKRETITFKPIHAGSGGRSLILVLSYTGQAHAKSHQDGSFF